MGIKKVFSTIQRSWWVVLAIALLGIVLHIVFWESRVQLLGDQVRDAMIVERMAEGHLAGRGPTSSLGGMHLGPFFYYLLFPFMAVSGFTPFGGVLFGTVMYALTIPLLFILLRRHVRASYAVLGVLLFAASELFFIFTQFIWNPNALFPFVVLWLLVMDVLYGVKTERTSRAMLLWQIGLGVLIGVLSQLHFIAGIVVPVTVVTLLLTKQHSWKQRGFGVLMLLVGAVLAYAPYIAAQITHDFEDVYRLIAFLREERVSVSVIDRVTISLERLGVMLRIFALSIYQESTKTMNSLFVMLAGVFTSAGVGFAWKVKQNSRFLLRIALATLVVGLLFQASIPAFYWHYTLLWIMLILVLLVLIAEQTTQRVKWALWIFLALFVATSIVNVFSSVSHITAIRSGEEIPEYGYRYPYMLEVADYLTAHPEIQSIACNEDQACIVIPYLLSQRGATIMHTEKEQANVFIVDLKHGEQPADIPDEIVIENALYRVYALTPAATGL